MKKKLLYGALIGLIAIASLLCMPFFVSSFLINHIIFLICPLYKVCIKYVHYICAICILRIYSLHILVVLKIKKTKQKSFRKNQKIFKFPLAFFRGSGTIEEMEA